MPTTITRYKCNKCGGEYDQQSDASACEGRHPSDTISFARATQTYLPYNVVPDNLKLTHSGKTYTYFIKK